MSVYRAARAYGVPESTLRDRTRGNVDVDEAQPGPKRIFTREQEQELVEHVKYMANIGYGYSKTNVQYLAAEYFCSLSHGETEKIKRDKPLSDCWFYGFLKRWPDLKLAKPQKLSMARARCASREALDNYFKELACILTKNNLHGSPERIYNIDETGVNTEHTPPKIICDADTDPQAVTSPRSSTISIIGGGNAIGNHIPPYFVFPGKRWNHQFLDGAPSGSAGEMSDNGWSNSAVFQNYLEKHFAKHANLDRKLKSSKTLILYDGHKSHISLLLVDWAKKNNVILFVLPPHTSHVTQPLDVGVFGPFKSMYSRECQLYMRSNPGLQVTKYDVAKLTAKPYLKAMSPENLQAAFRKAGVHPFSNKVVADSKLAPSTIYTSPDNKNKENKVVPQNPSDSNGKEHEDKLSRTLGTRQIDPPTTTENQESSQPSAFFESRKITRVVNRPKKRFTPPTLDGTLSKKKNIAIMQASSLKKKLKENTAASGAGQTPAKNSYKRIPLRVKSTNCKASPKPSKSATAASPGPGPSGCALGAISLSSESESSNEESSNCCVCGKFSPPAIKHCVNLIIVKWAQCDKCDHWTHLSFCTETSVVRRHSEFLCPHCQI